MSIPWLAPSTSSSSPSLLTFAIRFFGLDDARFSHSDWSLTDNPFWTTFLLTIVVFPCLFYLTWFLNPSLSKNRLGLSWVLGFYSATLFTIAGFYEVPHLRTIFNAAIDYVPAHTSASFIGLPTNPAVAAELITSTTSLNAATAVSDICYPVLKVGVLALFSRLPSYLRLDQGSTAKYFCFSDFTFQRQPGTGSLTQATASLNEEGHGSVFATVDEIYPLSGAPGATDQAHDTFGHKYAQRQHHRDPREDDPVSLRHRVFQGQMKRPHLMFSLENYPDDGRIGPHIIAANFQAFLLCDLVLGAIHYRKQLEPFSTVVHHIIYYFIVVHMRAGNMLSVFCICGTPIEASSIFLAFGRMFPHRRTPIIERLYLLCFVTTRLVYVALLWHEIFFNYPDKSVAFLYTITISLHVYWFVLYIQTQKKFKAKQRRLQLAAASEQALALAEKRLLAEASERPVAVGPEDDEEVLTEEGTTNFS
ncbi:hypothetical protein BGZ72_003220 [Mortierella alpina]|nr:hypothetical protein BGZ72_003220 [Mortierella alpina]